MAIPFSRTTRALASETSRFALWAWGSVAILFGAWLIWFVFVNVTLYEVSLAGRVEVEQAARLVTAPIAGKIATTSMRLGRSLDVGDVLMELDATTERLRLREEEARLTAIPPQRAALSRQIGDEERAVDLGRGATASGLQHAQARYREALSAALFAEDQSQRMAQRSLTLFEIRWATHLPVGTTQPRYLAGCRLAFGRFPYFLVQRQHLDRDILGLSL